MLSLAEGGVVILPSDLSASVQSRGASLFRTISPRGLSFRAPAPPDEHALYFALAAMRLRERIKLIAPWDDHCPQATHPWPGPAVPRITRRACLTGETSKPR